MILDETKLEIIEHAKSEYPKESCGLVLNISGKEVYYPCRNIAENQIDFILDPADFAAAEDAGQVLAVVHSHCDISPKPSEADLVGCEFSQLPWIIVALIRADSGEQIPVWNEFKPSGYKAPLLGRKFSHGVLDCYALLRDWYNENLLIELMEFERAEEWWKKGESLYLENFEKAGFVRVENLSIGDVIIMQVASTVPNHAAIYLGNDTIVHHLQNRLSCRDVYGGFWKKNTRMILRYKGEK
jgi:proteasome lid subunit RPN8/RPN11